jgi:hypothetical protein
VLTAKMANTEVTAETTGGSVDNNKLVAKDPTYISMTTADSADEAQKGLGVYTDTKAIPICTIAVLYDSFIHVVVAADSGINSIADMKGSCSDVCLGFSPAASEGCRPRHSVLLARRPTEMRLPLHVRDRVDAESAADDDVDARCRTARRWCRSDIASCRVNAEALLRLGRPSRRRPSRLVGSVATSCVVFRLEPPVVTPP